MSVISIKGLTRHFGSNLALDNVSLEIPSGTVMGLVGENGAGKTTLIKHILGLLKAQSGSVRVFDLDPVASPEIVLAKIGYLSEDGDVPAWMKVKELLRYAAGFYPTWDEEYAKHLVQQFGLELNTPLAKLSKGQRSRAGLVAAMAYHPPLLVLDEPSSGLDPIVRRDILGAIIRTIADEGRTVLFSSHLLGEVERVSDRIAIMKSGRILLDDTLDSVKENYRRLTLLFSSPLPSAPSIEGCIAWQGSGREWSAVCNGNVANVETEAKVLGAQVIGISHLSLDDIFVAHVGVPAPTGAAS